MKYLSDYTEEAKSELFKTFGAFFAFSDKQFNEQKEHGIKYVDLSFGLLAPEKTHEELIEKLDNIHHEGIKKDIEENGIPAILQREFRNHECQIAGDPEDAINALEDYHIDPKKINTEWVKYME